MFMPAFTPLRYYSKRLRRRLVAVCALGVCAALCLLCASFVAQKLHVEESAWSQLVEDAQVSTSIDWGYLQSINPDIVGWITVENTSISYPLLDPSQRSVEYYLSHDIWGNASSSGCIVLAESSSLDAISSSASSMMSGATTSALSNQLYVYGHHLSGTTLMFSELGNAWQAPSFSQIGRLHLFTPDAGEVIYEPSCAAHIYETDELYFQQTSSLDELNLWFSQVWEKADVTQGESCETITQSITLITCSSQLSGQPWRCAITFIQASSSAQQVVLDIGATNV